MECVWGIELGCRWEGSGIRLLIESCWVGAEDGAKTEVLDWGGVEIQMG